MKIWASWSSGHADTASFLETNKNGVVAYESAKYVIGQSTFLASDKRYNNVPGVVHSS